MANLKPSFTRRNPGNYNDHSHLINTQQRSRCRVMQLNRTKISSHTLYQHSHPHNTPSCVPITTPLPSQLLNHPSVQVKQFPQLVTTELAPAPKLEESRLQF